MRKARRILAIGKAAPTIAKALGSLPGVALEVVETLEKAVEDAVSHAHAGDAVLLSPACASFDQFRNFEHRGEVFESLVRALPERAVAGRR